MTEPVLPAECVAPRKGDLFVAYADARPADRVFIEVTRVAKSGAWADLKCFTWAVMWTKRQPLPLRYAVKRDWHVLDLERQMEDWEAKRAATQSDGSVAQPVVGNGPAESSREIAQDDGFADHSDQETTNND